MPDVLLEEVLKEDAKTSGEDPALDESWLGVRLLFKRFDHTFHFFWPAKHEVSAKCEIKGGGILLKRLEPDLLFYCLFIGEVLDDLIIHSAEPILLKDEFIKVSVFDLLGEITAALA